MDVGSPIVADAQPAVLVEPGDRALNDPALHAQPGAVLGLALRDPGLIRRARSSRRCAFES